MVGGSSPQVSSSGGSRPEWDSPVGHQHGAVALLPGAGRVSEVPARAGSRGARASSAWPGGDRAPRGGGCRVRAPALPSRRWPWRGDRRESPPPTRGCSSFRGRARQPAAPPRGRWGHCRSLGLPSTHAGLLAPGWHQRVSWGLSWGLDGGQSRAEGVILYLCLAHAACLAPGACSAPYSAPSHFPVFFFAFWLCQQTVTKSWQNRAEPLAPGGLSPRETQQCVSSGCGWEITRRAGDAGDGTASAVSLIRGFL